MLRQHWRVFLLVAAPAALASVASSVLTAMTPAASSWWWSVLSGCVLAVLVVALAWAQLASAQAVVDLDDGKTVTLGSLVTQTRARVPALLATVALWAVVVVPLLATGVLTPVALVLVVAWSLVLPVVQLEHLAGWRALRRSARLVRPQLLTVLLALAVSLVLVTVLGGVLATLVFIVVPAPWGVVSGVPQLVAAVVWPVTALLATYTWANGRAAEEAEDVSPPGAGAAPATARA